MGVGLVCGSEKILRSWRQNLNAKLRNMENALFILSAIEGNQRTRGGNLPVGYKRLHTLKDVGNFILELEANK